MITRTRLRWNDENTWRLLMHFTTAFPPHPLSLFLGRGGIYITDPCSSDRKFGLQRDRQRTIRGKWQSHDARPLLLGLPLINFLQNEDCGQMSAWYLFSALGFYPVNPVSGEYVVGRYASSLFSVFPPPPSILMMFSPFFDTVSIDLPSSSKKLDIVSPGASSKPYVHSLSVNGREVEQPIIRHDQITQGGVLSFQMRDTPQAWASGLTFQQ